MRLILGPHQPVRHKAVHFSPMGVEEKMYLKMLELNVDGIDAEIMALNVMRVCVCVYMGVKPNAQLLPRSECDFWVCVFVQFLSSEGKAVYQWSLTS